MREVVVNTFLTLDGVMQAPGGPEEDPAGEFTHGGWSVNYWDDVMGQVMDESVQEPFDLLLGRRTYEIFAAHWPHVSDDVMADKLNEATKYVASRTLQEVEWANSKLLEGDAGDAVRRLKEQPGPQIQVHGSADLIQTLLRDDLIDRFRVWIFPVVLGTGKRLFGDGTLPGGLRLVDSRAATTGVLITTYERAGDIPYGSFALEEPTEAELERRRSHEED
jgi:dihydrofolate reductase